MDKVLITGKEQKPLEGPGDLPAPLSKRVRTKSFLTAGLITSLLLHLIGYSLMNNDFHTKDTSPPVVHVNIIPEELLQEAAKLVAQKQKTQIVSKTNQKESKEPIPDTALLSDINVKTKKQQIRKGDNPAAGPKGQGGQQKQRLQKSKRAPFSKRPQKKLDLSPAKNTLSMIKQKTLPNTASAATTPLQTVQSTPFSRAPGNAVLFSGAPGVSDLLPDISDGDITLLNAKANKFAVFVRRVAVRVFQQIKIDGWDFLRAGDIRKVQQFLHLHAVLDAKGNLVSLTIERDSGSTSFDRIIKGAVKKTVSDPNPPQAALAADGKIHFIFHARSWAEYYQSQRGPAERRWLVLKTGLR